MIDFKRDLSKVCFCGISTELTHEIGIHLAHARGSERCVQIAKVSLALK